MPKRRSVEDLSIEELRWLLIEKRRAVREERLDKYRRTGRAVVVTPDIESSQLDDLHTGELLEDVDDTQPSERSGKRKIFDRFLLVIEICAVVGFIFVLFNGLNLMKELNQEVVTVLKQPTLTPTPLIVAVVLPSGHTPPDAPGGSRPNEAEIPDHLRPLVQSLAEVALPTPGPEQAVRIQIPAINVDAPVVQGDGWEQLKKGVGQNISSPNPGQNGNIILSAHNDIFGEIFRDLDQLEIGDQLVLFTSQRAYTYSVLDTKIVEPDEVSVMAQTSKPTVTLISCYPYLVDDQRVVVIARLMEDNS